jgi:uncharacterized protein
VVISNSVTEHVCAPRDSSACLSLSSCTTGSSVPVGAHRSGCCAVFLRSLWCAKDGEFSSVVTKVQTMRGTRGVTYRRGWVWFDLENTPHVLFLEPLVRRVEASGWVVRISAKPQAQTLDLAHYRGLDAAPVGGGDFVGRGRKILGGVSRALALAHWARRYGRPALMVSSSRSASLAAWLLRVPGVGLLDYEHSEKRTLALNAALWLPDVLRGVPLRGRARRVVRFYAGLKENLYLDAWRVERDAERRRLGVGEDQYLVAARPAADTAHYQRDDSARLWMAAIRGLDARPGVRLVVVSRTGAQRAALRTALAGCRSIDFVEQVVNGPALVSAADLVLGGGGTMNREAAALGVPAWSTFCGAAPAIDEALSREGRLRWLRSDSEVERALADPLPGLQSRRGPFPDGLDAIVEDIQSRLRGGGTDRGRAGQSAAAGPT